MQGMTNPVHFDIVGKAGAKQTTVASVTTDGFKNITVLPKQFSPTSDASIAAGFDALRRLGRVDMAVHYPELGITMDDTCGGI